MSWGHQSSLATFNKLGFICTISKLLIAIMFDVFTQKYSIVPFVSETTRCVSNDFIEINDDAGQNVVRFYV